MDGVVEWVGTDIQSARLRVRGELSRGFKAVKLNFSALVHVAAKQDIAHSYPLMHSLNAGFASGQSCPAHSSPHPPSPAVSLPQPPFSQSQSGSQPVCFPAPPPPH